jgi:hypothetical protein
MKKCFPKLTQTHVWIQTEPGKGFNCPMLPISALSEMKECSDLLACVSTIEDFEQLRLRLLALVKTVMPEEYWNNLLRLDITQLTDIVAYLMYGDDDDLPRQENSEKN